MTHGIHQYPRLRPRGLWSLFAHQSVQAFVTCPCRSLTDLFVTHRSFSWPVMQGVFSCLASRLYLSEFLNRHAFM
ncbi:hypothetical protein L210DRAFT_3573151 [Boletus edulis BED1]|uniref:Uncharacterized protein n=1 Tax=Boletus edulis BED1 TaxID=1328754 RepID=A0AAD4G717_BOLED|nr:hypothetical protein L210DRAFT_3573151 [Boletus edulis BED1]